MSKVKATIKMMFWTIISQIGIKKAGKRPFFLEGRAVDIAHFYRKGESRNYKKNHKKCECRQPQTYSFCFCTPSV